MALLDTVRWLVDEVIDTVRRNSRKGKGTGHWYPGHDVEVAIGSGKNCCFYCGRYDQGRTVHTKPPCPGKKGA